MDEVQAEAPPKRNHATDIITSGSVWRAVWFLAWPTALNTVILQAYSIINGIFLGHLSNKKAALDALTAVGYGQALLMIQFGITIGVSAGTSALAARFLGARSHNEADEVVGQSLVLSAVAGIVTSIPLILFAHPFFYRMGARGDALRLATDYTTIIAWFSVPMFVYLIAQAALRAAGDVRSPLYAGAAVIFINIAFDFVLIRGFGRIPSMGVHGAAIATGISRIAGVVITLLFLKKSVLRESFAHWRPHPGWYARILNIGWPAAAQNMIWTTAFTGFMWVLGKLPNNEGGVAVAALVAASRIEGFAFMPGVAYSMAATPLVGQNLGAGQPDRAEHSAWVATGQAAFIMLVMAVVFLTIPAQLASIFTPNPAFVALVVLYLRINALSEPLLAVNMVLRGALQGAGDVRVPALLTIITYWLVRLPFAYLLAIKLRYGAMGAWIAMSSTTGLSGILVAIWFKRGHWKKQRV